MSNPAPAIVFELYNLRPATEAIGPITNQKEVTVLHPDQYNSYYSAEVRYLISMLHNMGTATWLPGVTGGENYAHRINENLTFDENGYEQPGSTIPTFTLYGEKALYMKKMYADADATTRKSGYGGFPLLRVYSIDGVVQ